MRVNVAHQVKAVLDRCGNECLQVDVRHGQLRDLVLRPQLRHAHKRNGTGCRAYGQRLGLALEQFMRARIERQDRAVLEMLTDDFRTRVGGWIRSPLTQVSNPCWYRYEVLALEPPTANRTTARVRVYTHLWSGDNGGSLPESWEQEIGLVQTAAGWRVDRLGDVQNPREEAREPRGWNLSACTAARQVPGPTQPTPLPNTVE